MAIICASAMVMIEAAGMMSRKNARLSDENSEQMLSAT
jgi:hypothetical protein